ncbi:ubiquitin-conjugating enzyme E2 R1 [Capsaspora owczarzaki ATCC 30864]|uniref:Ubiquitin-conjugating enzyme E2 R1 n=1 Tax=Capsaspora owczarzaki (strain ATCC 30864) TaxID=595528 RepID=A0A0D2WW62_CAPO3|nr:ubiquitin-conjugating enzyme E2 R1 [Capsaspora owczarzaki ATCC 30864]KJE96668.1 ubiquitin-conjugating enzyme E2 R1 [Capsaspora owczarzaki ATCC 30864]|eukprot:XP_004343680.2 ubiquitin-conjugating enzyme E2 R1 [Capsaspora owczarzaki ATCC 30864]
MSAKALASELTEYQKHPVDGFDVSLVDDSNLYDWRIGIFGPPKTPYAGGYFKARVNFPKDYPYSPPSIRFETELWHPNIFKTGELCISILHPPGDDPMSGERPEERWNPTQNVRTILLSVISLLNEPNTSSPANIDASVMFMKNLTEYRRIVSAQVRASQEIARQEGVAIPTSVEEYTQRSRQQMERTKQDEEDAVDFENNYYDDDDDDDDGFDDGFDDYVVEDDDSALMDTDADEEENNNKTAQTQTQMAKPILLDSSDAPLKQTRSAALDLASKLSSVTHVDSRGDA